MMEGWAPAYNLTSHWHRDDITPAVIDIFRIETFKSDHPSFITVMFPHDNLALRRVWYTVSI